MKILILKAYYNPEKTSGIHLTNNLIEDLAESEFTIDLFTPMPTRGISKSTRNKYKKIKYEELYEGYVKVHRFSLFREYHSIILRAIRYLVANIFFLIKGIFTKNIKIIFTSSTPPTIGLVGAILKKIKKVPFVYNVQDIFPDSLLNTGLTKKNSFLWKIGCVFEDFVYKNADKITVISYDFKKNIVSKGVPDEKVEVIYNWVDQDAIVPIKREKNCLIERFDLNPDKFYVVYAGNLGYAQNIEVIIETAYNLQEYEEIEFIIFGDGGQEKNLKNMAKSLNLKNIKFFPLQPYSLVSHVYSLGDVSIVSCKEGFGRGAMPSKTWSIMSAGTPVVVNFDENTDLHSIIKNNNVGEFSTSGNVDEFKNAILKLYMNRPLCKTMGHNAREYVLNNLTRQQGTSKYIDLFKKLEE